MKATSISIVLCFACAAALPCGVRGDEPAAPCFQRLEIFPREKFHNHASCVVELPNGDLLAVWYHGHGERSSDDVLIEGARLKKGAKAWSPRFVIVDTPDYPDLNPSLFVTSRGALWMVWPTVLDHHWEGALLKFAVADGPLDGEGPPKWTREGVLHVTPRDFEKQMNEAFTHFGKELPKIDESEAASWRGRAGNLLYQRLGWMPRVHAVELPSGRILWPLYTDTFSVSLALISDDHGKSWQTGGPMIGFGNIQPSFVRTRAGTLVAFMRDNGEPRRIRVSTSRDDGLTWSPVVASDLPNPGAGVEAIALKSGRWALIYNDLSHGRFSLAVSLSDDEGRSWKWTRHIERRDAGPAQFHYPSIIQTRDGLIQATYTDGGVPAGSTIAHVRFNEAWIERGDGPRKP